VIKEVTPVLDDPESDEQVTEAINTLQQAIDQLRKYVDVSELVKLIEEAKVYNSDDYSEESYQVLTKAIEYAEGVVNDPYEETLSKALTDLTSAIDGLKIKTSDLVETINSIGSLEGYTDQTVSKL